MKFGDSEIKKEREKKGKKASDLRMMV